MYTTVNFGNLAAFQLPAVLPTLTAAYTAVNSESPQRISGSKQVFPNLTAAYAAENFGSSKQISGYRPRLPKLTAQMPRVTLETPAESREAARLPR